MSNDTIPKIYVLSEDEAKHLHDVVDLTSSTEVEVGKFYRVNGVTFVATASVTMTPALYDEMAAAVGPAQWQGNLAGPGGVTAGNVPAWVDDDQLSDGYPVKTTLADPGVDTALASEKAIRTAIAAGDATNLALIQNLSGVRDVAMSFVTAEQTTTRLYFPYKVTISKIRGIVMIAIGATSAGTITCGNSTGASANGVITAAAGDALNTLYSVSPTTNNVVAANSYYYLTSAKAATASGKVLVTLEYVRTP